MKRSFNPLMLLLLVGILYTIYALISTHGQRDYEVVVQRANDSIGRDEAAARAVSEGGG